MTGKMYALWGWVALALLVALPLSAQSSREPQLTFEAIDLKLLDDTHLELTFRLRVTGRVNAFWGSSPDYSLLRSS